jgi:predicted acylesterase/phospholipase RssA
MAPAKLDIKVDGVVENFDVDGVEWVDGSIQADMPFKRISTLFNVSVFVVCQVNFHVAPFIQKVG